MAKKRNTDPRTMMEHAIEVMRRSIPERRADGKASPKVGAVLVLPDGTVDTAYRGELRDGDHAEFTLLERKNRHRSLDGAVLYATLEPCAPGARRHPKLGCAERIVLARIKQVYVGIADPDPTVDGKGIRYMEDNGVKVRVFDKDLQDIIKGENKAFIAEALERAAADREEKPPKKVQLSPLEHAASHVGMGALSSEALEAFRNAAKIGEAAGSEGFNQRLLRQGILVESGKGGLVPSGFGLLLFGKEPRLSYPQAGLLATIHYPNGKEEPKDFVGPLVLIPREVEAWLRDKLPNVADRSSMERRSVDALPFEMVREAVVNALVHRDYAITGSKCQLIVDTDAIVIKSPGRPVPQITLEQIKAFKAPQASRNPTLHFAFGEMDMAEERGLGLRTLKKEAHAHGLPLPKYEWSDPYLELTLYRNAAGALKDLPPDKASELNKAERAGWEWLATQEEVTSGQYQAALSVSNRTAVNHLKKFEAQGLVDRLGSGPSTRYRVVRP